MEQVQVQGLQRQTVPVAAIATAEGWRIHRQNFGVLNASGG